MNSENFRVNRKRLAEMLEEDSIVYLYSGRAEYETGDEKYQFAPSKNFYYLTGLDSENMMFVLQKQKEEVRELLFMPQPNSLVAKWDGPMLDKGEAEEISGIQEVHYLDEFEKIFSGIMRRSSSPTVYFDLERIEWWQRLSYSELFAEEFRKKYPGAIVKNIFSKLAALRRIKSQAETDCIRKAIDITRQGLELMMKNSKAGMMEYELEAYFDFTLKKNGVRPAFNTIAASGKNGPILHYRANNSRTSTGDLILFDLGAEYRYYKADITRTFPLDGKFTQRQRDIYNMVLEAGQASIECMKPGVPYKYLNQAVTDYYKCALKKIGLISDESEVSKYCYHGTSHYLGLDTHDVGEYDVLKSGMVLTVEPGLYLAEEGFGIRIEDNILVTDDGYEVLSKDIIKTIPDIENFMG